MDRWVHLIITEDLNVKTGNSVYAGHIFVTETRPTESGGQLIVNGIFAHFCLY
jgi:hypothetical protein